MSISDTLKAQSYASVAEVAAAQAKLYADKLESAPDYAEQAAESALAAASSAQVAVSAESVVNDLAISASESATSAAASAAEAGNAAAAAVGQCIRVPPGELVDPLPAAASRINTFLVFSEDGSVSLMPESDVAILDSEGKIPVSMIPAVAISQAFVVSSQAAMLSLDAQTGDVAKRTDLGYSFILSAEPASTLSNWVQLTDDVLAQLGLPTGATQVGATDDSGGNTTVQGALDLKVSIASLSSNGTAQKIGTAGGISIQAWMGNDFRSLFGGIPDYVGTPLYDGNDASRITATNNSPALQTALQTGTTKNGVLYLYFPRGHYGFKNIIPTVTASSTMKEIVMFGDGIEETILDFIYEDTTHTTGVDESTANALLRLTGFDKVTFCNMTTKCTTKAGPVDGNMSPDNGNPSAYFGAVWFSHIQDCKEVNYYNVLSERANYRGHSISGEGMPIGSRTYVNLYNCHGRYTTSSPWWLRHCNKLSVYGGEFYRNGFKGITATGYGITANQYVDDVYLTGASFYENYRKGFDRHSGIGSLIAVNCTFIDNVLFDIYDNKQYFGLYPSDKYNYVSIYGCSFILNRNKQWLKEAIDAIYTGDFVYKNVIAIYDESISAAPVYKNSKVHVSSCSFRCMGPLLTPYKNFLGIKGDSSELRVENCDIDWSEFSLLQSSNTSYTSQPFTNSESGNRVVMSNCSVALPDGLLVKSGGVSSNTVMFTMFGTGTLVLESNEFDIKNYVLVAGTASGASAQSPVVKKINNNIFKFRDIQLETFGVTVASGFQWFEHPLMFGNASTSVQSGMNRIGVGDCAQVFDFNFGTNLNTPMKVTIRADNKPVGSTLKFLLGQTGGNVQFDLVGKIGLSSDRYSGYYRGSLNTQVVVTGSSYVGMGSTLADEIIKYNGVNTNFVAKAVTMTWATASNTGNGEYYVAEISCRQSYTPVIVGIY